MKKFFVTFLFTCTLFVCSTINAQTEGVDIIQTDQGELGIRPILHASLVLEWDGKSVYVDPYGGYRSFRGVNPPDVILITDVHQDHMDLNTLENIDMYDAEIISPQKVAEEFPINITSDIIILGNGDEAEVDGMTFKAIPMYNLPESNNSPHKKGRGNGYVISIGGKNIYISGDTEDIPEMRSLKDIDVAFICMNLPYTMDINQAADAVLEFAPKIVYPYHYKGSEGFSDVNAFKEKVNKANPNIEVRLRDWYSREY